MEAATQLLALSSIAVVDRDVLYLLHVRWFIQVQDVAHDFAYAVRKAIEITEGVAPGALKAAQDCLPHRANRTFVVDLGESLTATGESLWWIVNRLVHSQEITVKETIETIVGPPWAQAHQSSSRLTPRFLGFRSDRDPKGTTHYVGIQDLVGTYLAAVEPYIQHRLRLRREDPFAAP
jgi:hypothetical protein